MSQAASTLSSTSSSISSYGITSTRIVYRTDSSLRGIYRALSDKGTKNELKIFKVIVSGSSNEKARKPGFMQKGLKDTLIDSLQFSSLKVTSRLIKRFTGIRYFETSNIVFNEVVIDDNAVIDILSIPRNYYSFRNVLNHRSFFKALSKICQHEKYRKLPIWLSLERKVIHICHPCRNLHRLLVEENDKSNKNYFDQLIRAIACTGNLRYFHFKSSTGKGVFFKECLDHRPTKRKVSVAFACTPTNINRFRLNADTQPSLRVELEVNKRIGNHHLFLGMLRHSKTVKCHVSYEETYNIRRNEFFFNEYIYYMLRDV